MIRVSNRKLFDGLFEAGGVTDPIQKLTALRAIDDWAGSDRGEDEEGAAQLVRTALDSLLGVRA